MITRAKTTYELSAVNADDLTVDIVASTFAINSYNYRVDCNGCDLSEFRRNPAICYGHDDRGLVVEGSGLPVAKALVDTIRVEDGRLKMKIQFTPEDVNPFGYKVFRMVQAGFLSGVSVGFNALAWEDHEEMVDGQSTTVPVCTKWKLFEISIVTIPANGEAMIVRARQLNRESEVEHFRTLAAEIETEANRGGRTLGTVDEVLAILDDCPAKELIIKHRNYFENKQPVNKIASRVLGKFFKRVLDQEPPADEKEAWEKVEQGVEAIEPTKEATPEPEKAPETPAETPEPVVTAPEPTPEEKPAEETPEPSNTPAPEAPELERKASVLLPLSSLASLQRSIKETCVQAAVEASRQGLPVGELNGVIDAVGHRFQGALSPSPSL